MKRVQGLQIATAAAAVVISTHAANAQCSVARDARLEAGALYILFPDRTLLPLRRAWSRVSNTSIRFVDGLKLLYVVDLPQNNGEPRRTSGALAVRLVATSGNGSRGQHARVHLRRDAVDTRRTRRPEWNGSIKSQTYFNFHSPSYVPASDSYLQREFHTNYVYIAGAPERSTHTPVDRRAKFHFPEMSGASATGFFPQLFGSGTYVETPDKRFEAQIKYYRPRAEERCVVIQPQLQGDDTGLKVTISDLDRGTGSDWQVIWADGVPTQ